MIPEEARKAMQGRQPFLQALPHLNRNRKRCQLFQEDEQDEQDEQNNVTQRQDCEGWNHEACAKWLAKTRLRGEVHISPACRIMPCAAARSSLNQGTVEVRATQTLPEADKKTSSTNHPNLILFIR